MLRVKRKWLIWKKVSCRENVVYNFKVRRRNFGFDSCYFCTVICSMKESYLLKGNEISSCSFKFSEMFMSLCTTNKTHHHALLSFFILPIKHFTFHCPYYLSSFQQWQEKLDYMHYYRYLCGKSYTCLNWVELCIVYFIWHV